MSVVLTVLVVAASAAVVWGSRQGGRTGESRPYEEQHQAGIQETQGGALAQEQLGQDNPMAGFAAVGEEKEPAQVPSGAADGATVNGNQVSVAQSDDIAVTESAADTADRQAAAANAEVARDESETQETDPEDAEVSSNLVNPVADLPFAYFNEASTMQWPLEGSVLLDFSMDSTIYHPTLDLYKTNPAILIQAEAGTTVTAPAEGKVVAVDHNEEIGDFIVIDLGNGYQAKCGQLTEIPVSSGDIVEAGAVIGQVAEPTKYYVVEGSNLYFSVTKDGTPVDPLDYIR